MVVKMRRAEHEHEIFWVWDDSAFAKEHLLGKVSAGGALSAPTVAGEEWVVREKGGAEVLRTVAEHDPAEPYYLFWAPHIAHVPLEVPSEYYVRFDNLPDGDTANHARQIYEAMTNFADTMVGNLTAALKGKGREGGGRSMYDDTLIVFTSGAHHLKPWSSCWLLTVA